MVLISNASSNLRRGGFTTRGGGNTEEMFEKEAPTTESKPSLWNRMKGWFGDHAEGVGKAAGIGVGLVGAGVDAAVSAYGGTPWASKLVSNLKKENADYGKEDSTFGKFMKGFTHKRIQQNIPGVLNAADKVLDKGFHPTNPNYQRKSEHMSNLIDAIFADESKDKKKKKKVEKKKEMLKLIAGVNGFGENEPPFINNPINSSNGHVPQGYPKSSVGTAKFVKPSNQLQPDSQIGKVKPYYVPPSIGADKNRISQHVANEWNHWNAYSRGFGNKGYGDLTDKERRKLIKKLKKWKKRFAKLKKAIQMKQKD